MPNEEKQNATAGDLREKWVFDTVTDANGAVLSSPLVPNKQYEIDVACITTPDEPLDVYFATPDQQGGFNMFPAIDLPGLTRLRFTAKYSHGQLGVKTNSERQNPLAFPSALNEFTEPSKGMTLLDYFAAKAMAGLYAFNNGENGDDRFAGFADGESMSKAAYDAAEAMLAERAKRGIQ